eukprot:13427453-Ditylum_brightwellii.AAC.1
MVLFDGTIHKRWTKYQDDHLYDKKLWTPRSNGTQWSVQVICTSDQVFWDTFFELWMTRNEKVHGTGEKARYHLKAEHYKSIIKTMYHHRDRLLAADRQYMFQSLTEIKEFLRTKSLAYIKMWIAVWYPCYKKGIKKGQKQAIQVV